MYAFEIHNTSSPVCKALKLEPGVSGSNPFRGSIFKKKNAHENQAQHEIIVQILQ